MPGICISPGCLPTQAQIASLRPDFVRSLIYTLDDLDRLKALGAPILLTLNTECDLVGQDWSGWDGALTAAAERADGHVFLVEAGNELDALGVDVETAADLARRAAEILHPYGIQVGATSVVSGDWQGYLARLADLCRDEVDYFGLHPYGQTPTSWSSGGWGFGEMRVAISRAYELAQKPIVCSEVGIKIGDAGGEWNHGQYLLRAAGTIDALSPAVCPYWSWFAWHDRVGGPSERGDQAFGLMAEDGQKRPAWETFVSLASVPPFPPPPPINPPTYAEIRAGLEAIRDQADALLTRIP